MDSHKGEAEDTTIYLFFLFCFSVSFSTGQHAFLPLYPHTVGQHVKNTAGLNCKVLGAWPVSFVRAKSQNARFGMDLAEIT